MLHSIPRQLVLVVLLCSTNVIEAFIRPGLKSGSCALSFISSMRTYDCVGLNLSEVPQNLHSSTEVLDASMNRIRILTNSSLKRYSSIKKLYLNDNMILRIESGAFDGMSSLETLDLNINALIEVPVSIFHLPALHQLMLANNLMLNISNLINKALPITAPIKYLDMSYSPLLLQMPQFGVFMDLIHLNVTGNNLTNISIDNFIGLCNLQYFTGDNLTMEFNGVCDCHKIDKWFQQIHVKSQPPFFQRCLFAKDECFDDVEPSEDDKVKHKICRQEYQERETIRSVANIALIVLAVIGGIVLFVGVCFIYARTQRLPDIDAKVKKDIKSEKTGALLPPNNNDIEC